MTDLTLPTTLGGWGIIGLACAGVYVVYKALTSVAGEPHVENAPENPQFYGDDNMTFMQGLHAENRLQNIKATHVDAGLAHASINGAIFEVNPDTLNPPQFHLPKTLYVKQMPGAV
jgi:hypothetical protein